MENREIVIDCNDRCNQGFKIESIAIPLPSIVHTNVIYLEGNSFRPFTPAPLSRIPVPDPLEKEELQNVYRSSYPCPSCKKYISGCILRAKPPEPFTNTVNCPLCVEDITNDIYFHSEQLSEEKAERYRLQLKLREQIVMEKIEWRLRDDPRTLNTAAPVHTVKCTECGAKILRAKMDRHYLSKHQKYLCEHCGIYVGLVQFKRHQIKHEEKNFKCTKCDFKCHYKKSLVRHQLVHDKDESSMYSCKFCGHFLTSRWNLQQHIRIHTNVTPYKCLLCKKYFRYNCSLKSHIIVNHPGKSIPDSMTRIMNTSLGKEKESMDGISDEDLDKNVEKNGEDDDEDDDDEEKDEDEESEEEDEYNSDETEENNDESSDSDETSEDFDGS